MRTSVKHHLGKFARTFAKQMEEEPPKLTNIRSESSQKRTRTFYSIADILEKYILFGAGMRKQRVNSAGDQRRKFQGQLAR